MGVGAALFGGSALSALSGRSSSKRSTSAIKRAGDQSAQVQREALESFNERTQPFRDVGVAAAAPILAELGIEIPESLGGLSASPTSTPSRSPLFDFLQKEGFEDIQESAAAGSFLRSDGTLQNLERFSQGLASQQQLLDDQRRAQRFDQLFGLLGLGSNAATGQGTAGLQTAQNLGNIINQSGLAQAQGIQGSGQALQNFIGDATGVLGLQQSGALGEFQNPFTSGGFRNALFGGPTGFGQSGFAGTFGI